MEGDSEDRNYMLVILLVAVIAAGPLFNRGYPATHDGNHHYLRLVELDHNIKDGEVYARWLPNLAYGYGYPLFNFYPPLSFYVAESFHLLGLGFVSSLKLTYFFAFFAAALAMYLFVKEILGSDAALIAAISYTFVPYRILDVYVRGTLAESFSFIFYPLIFWSLYKVSESGRMWYLITGSFSYALLILTHNVMAFVFTPVALTYSVLLMSKKRGGYARYLAYIFFFGAGISAFYWLPALLELQYIRAGGLLYGYFDYHNHFVYPSQLLSRFWGFEYSCPGMEDDGMSFQIGIAQVICTLISILVFYRLAREVETKVSEMMRHLAFFIALTAILTFFTNSLSAPLWEHVPLVEYVQFPWRHLAFIAFTTSFLSGSCFLLFKDKRHLGLVVLGLFLILPSVPYLKTDYHHYVNESKWTPEEMTKSGYTATARRDYTPIDVLEMPTEVPEERFSVLSGDIKMSLIEHKSTYYIFRGYAGNDSRVRIENFWFPGWRAYVDGKEVIIEHSNQHGVMEVEIPRGATELVVRFEDTPIRRIGEAVSFLSLILIVAVTLTSKRYACF